VKTRSVMQPSLKPCPVPTLEPGSTKVVSVCNALTSEFFCPECWARVKPDTRRAFNAERKRLRKVRSLSVTTLMRELIAMAITEAAKRRAVEVPANTPPADQA
jgi:hypothetical protein